MNRTYGHVIPPTKINFGLAVRGWTKGELASRAGVSNGVVSKACAGERVSPKSIDRIARAFESTAPRPDLVELLREERAS